MDGGNPMSVTSAKKPNRGVTTGLDARDASAVTTGSAGLGGRFHRAFDRQGLKNRIVSAAGSVLLVAVTPVCALATQTHGEPEGLFVHQMAHAFFVFSMGLLIFWLEKRRLTVHKGWRSIQMGALFFILWNLNTILSHWLEEQTALLKIRTVGVDQLLIETDPSLSWLGTVYYFTKLDHLLCVPALFLLFWGLRRLARSTFADQQTEDPAP